MLPGTAQAWIEALTDGRAWDRQRDAERVRAGFVILARTVRRWPAPVEFIDALPPVKQLALVRESVPASPEVAEANKRRINELLRGAYDRAG